MNLPPHSLKVSVGMCTYNSDSFLEEQLKSIAAQIRLPDEIIICDDGSTDRTLDILHSWKESVSFTVQIYQNSKNLGYTKNFEKVMRLCTGDIIFLADHDDIWRPDRVSLCVEEFQKDELLGLITTNAELIDAEGTLQAITLREYINLMHVHHFWCFFFPPGNTMELWTGCTMAIRRTFLNHLLPIPNHFACHDIWIYLCMPLYAKIKYLDTCLIQYRLHGENYSTAPTVQNLLAHPSQWNYYNTILETLDFHGDLFHPLIAQAKKMPEGSLKHRFLQKLYRHQKHFARRKKICQHFWKNIGIFLGEILNGGYFFHPQGFRSMLYDFVKGSGIKS